MKQYKIVLSEKEIKNLKTFLCRATLNGTEASEFMNVAHKINTAEEIMEETNE